MPFFSSQEWTYTIVDTNIKYIGLWGLTVESFNDVTLKEVGGLFWLMYVVWCEVVWYGLMR